MHTQDPAIRSMLGGKMATCNQSSKRPKVHEEDRTSKLPDEILAVIRSKLSLPEIATTCTVSKRWSRGWKETIALKQWLEFHGNKKYWMRVIIQHRRLDEYVNWVKQIMALHSAPTLEKFAISYPLDSEWAEDINEWVGIAAKKSVRMLRLDLCTLDALYRKKGVLPYDASNVFTNSPMKCLRYLLLRKVNVADEVLEGLLSNSPLLEHLVVVRALAFCKLKVSDDHHARNLKYLEICECPEIRSLEVSVLNLECLVIFENWRLEHVKICAPNLKSLTFYAICCSIPRGFLDVDVPLPHLSQVCLGHNGIVPGSVPKFECFDELLAQVSQVKILRLYMTPSVFLDIAKTIRPCYGYPELNNLEHLEVSMLMSYHNSLLISYYSFVMCFIELMKAASLRTVKFKMLREVCDLRAQQQFIPDDVDFTKGLSQSDEDEDDDQCKVVLEELIPANKNLKVLEFVGFTGCSGEVQFLLKVAKFAVSLERIIIDVRIPRAYKIWKENLSLPEIKYSENVYAEMCRNRALQLKTFIRPDIDIVLI